MWGSSSAGALENVEYPFIAIAPRSTLALTGSTWQGPIYGSNRTKPCTHAKLNCLKYNCLYILKWTVWNRTVIDIETVYSCKTELFEIQPFWHVTVCKRILMLSWIIWNRTEYMYKNGFGIIDLQWLRFYKIKPKQYFKNRTTGKENIFLSFFLSFFLCKSIDYLTLSPLSLSLFLSLPLSLSLYIYMCVCVCICTLKHIIFWAGDALYLVRRRIFLTVLKFEWNENVKVRKWKKFY